VAKKKRQVPESFKANAERIKQGKRPQRSKSSKVRKTTRKGK
jgi:hypothetical protein